MENALKYLRNLFIGAALVVVLVAQAPASAQDEVDKATLAAAVELVEASGMAKLFDSMLPIIFKQIVALVVQVKPELKGKYDIFVKEFLDTAMSEGRDNIMREIAVLYARKLTVDEINDVVVFYRSTTGRKLIDLLPEFQADASKIGQEWGATIARQTLEKLRAKLKEDGHEF